MRIRVSTLLLIGILVIAAVFRLWKLDSIPLGLWLDEGLMGNVASQVIHDGDLRAFYPVTSGLEALYPNVASIFIGAFDLSGMEREAWMIRFPAALFGILTVWGVYLLAKELFSTSTSAASPSLIPRLSNAELLALSAAFFLATGFWHVNFSRIAFYTVTSPFSMSFAIFFLFRAVRTWKISDFAIAGFFFGLGLYSHPSARFLPLVGLLPLSFGVFSHYKTFLQKPGGLLPLAAFVGMAVLTALPVLAFYWSDPGFLTERFNAVGVLNAQEPLAAFWESVRRHLQMFHVEGDPNWRHNIPGEPMLLSVVGIVFLLGFFFLIWELVSHLVGKRFWEALPLATLFLWLTIMLLPAALTSEGIPHASRSVGVLPGVVIVSALGVVRPLEILRNRFHIRPGPVIALLLVFSIFLGAQEFDKYFDDWAGNEDILRREFSQDTVDFGRYVRGLDEDGDIYVVANGIGDIVDGFPISAQNIMFLTEGSDITYLRPDELQSIQPREGRTLVVALMRGDPGLFEALRARFPAMIFPNEPFPVGILSGR